MAANARSSPNAGNQSRHLLRDFDHFCRSRFWCEAGDRPGFRAIDSPGGPLIPVFSSERDLARFCGAVRWFSTTGTDLLDLIPAGYRFVVDPGSPHTQILDPQATRRVLRVEAH